ncbi:MAG: hypothetical protein KA240_07815 [Nitrospira sp.]|jgi:hypothetical protein|nr:hypothetical protein [Nitrospira sp.]MBP6605577.1 hypothetical protein [Nitrospira sp.]HQY58146.1 hypothetical protein [Nitrospira sp.]HRA95578.1 hypothetical protein [Nitrospira sp.]
MIALSLLIVLVLYIVLAWIMIRTVGWLSGVFAFTAVTRKILQGLCAVFFVLLPTWDIIPGRLSFQHLCETEAGIKVFRTVEVEDEFFMSDGQPDQKKLVLLYSQQDKRDSEFSPWMHIVKVESSIQAKRTGEILGAATDFVYFGGWIGSRIAPMSPITCPKYPNHSVHGIIWQGVFKPKQAFMQGGK